MTVEKFNEHNKNVELDKMTQAIFGQSKENPGNKDPKDLVFATEVERERYVDKIQATDIGGDHADLVAKLTEAKKSIRAETREALDVLKTVLPKINAGKGTAADAKTWQDAENKLSNLGRDARMKQQSETLERLSRKPHVKSEIKSEIKPTQEETRAESPAITTSIVPPGKVDSIELKPVEPVLTKKPRHKKERKVEMKKEQEKVSSVTPPTPENTPVSPAPEVKKIDLIGKSIDDFNDYIKRNSYGNRIKQENGVAKWVVTDRKSEFSLVITKEGTVDYGMNVNTANFYYDN